MWRKIGQCGRGARRLCSADSGRNPMTYVVRQYSVSLHPVNGSQSQQALPFCASTLYHVADSMQMIRLKKVHKTPVYCTRIMKRYAIPHSNKHPKLVARGRRVAVKGPLVLKNKMWDFPPSQHASRLEFNLKSPSSKSCRLRNDHAYNISCSCTVYDT